MPNFSFSKRCKKSGSLHFTDILSLFSFSEALVLNERILTGSVYKGGGKYGHNDNTNSLLKKGIIRYYPEKEVKSGVDNYCKFVWKKIEDDADYLSQGDWSGYDFTLYRSLRRAEWATQIGVDHLVWPIFCSLPRAIISHNVQTSMGKLYSQLKSSLEIKIAELQGVGCPIPMYIPPIPAIILERCKGESSRFLDETLALREEFSAFREKYRKYQDLLANASDKSLGELIQYYKDAVSDVSRELSRHNNRRTDSKLAFEIWDAICEVKSSGELGDLNTTLGLNLGSLLSKGAKGIEIHRVKAKARSLFDLYNKVMRIHDYGALITKTFHIDANVLYKHSKLAQKLALTCDALANVKRNKDWEGIK